MTSCAALLAVALAAPAAGAAGPGTPTDVASRFYAAIHRFDAAGAAALASGKEAPRILSSFVELSRAYARLEEAVARRFGPEEASRVGYGAKSRAEALGFLAAHDEIDGDRARVVGADGRTLASLTRVKGQWRVDLVAALNLADGVEALERDARAAARASEVVIRGLAAGHFQAPAEALADFEARTARAVRAAPRPGERSL
ncbi:MAG: hypothetical protein HZB56_19605 [Deltaproteobacteria bacterium]|nr:hypothetical protein [Deltaproteobacteria bacterium]